MSTTDQFLEEFVEFLTPVYLALESPAGFRRLLRRLGHDPTAASAEAAVVALDGPAQLLSGLVELLGSKAWRGEALDDADRRRIARDVPAVVQALRGLPAVVDGVDLGARFFAELFDLLVVDYLRFRAPGVYRALVLLGVIESELVAPSEDPDGRGVEFERYHVRWERLGRFLVAPSDVAEEVYGLGGPAFDSARLLSNVAMLVDELGVLALPAEPSEPFADQVDAGAGDDGAGGGTAPVGLDVPLHRLLQRVDAEVGVIALPVKGRAAPFENDRGIGVVPYVHGDLAGDTPVTDDGTWMLHAEGGGWLAGGVVFGLRPSGLHVDADGAVPAGSFRLELTRAKPAGDTGDDTADDTAIVILGDPAGPRLEAQGFTVAIGGEDGDFYAAAGAEGLRLVIDVSGDPLLAQLVPGPIEADAGDVVGGWRLGRGIYLEQGSGLNLRVPLSRALFGVLRLRQLGIGLAFDPDVALITTVSGEVSIGPLSLSVEELGLRVAVVSTPDGAFGPFDLDTGVRFPSGYGARLDAGPVSGGGQLSKYDHEYRGALALRVESFGLAAFAVLTTRLPAGEPGFSFLASIFGELDVQLGYGFRLTGVGGIIGIDRGADVEALRSVLAAGRLDSILFPSAPIQDASVVLDDLAAIFPPRPGRYLVGPAAKLEWGTPTLVEGRIGVVLESGTQARAVIAGSVVTALPVRTAAVVVLRVDFVGTVDFASGAVGFDATLTNSRVLSWPVSGEAAVRAGWGPNAGLVASIGGFHPAFSPPPGFPDLRPITIDFATDNPRLTLTAYLALTLNTVQAGGHASLYVKGPKIIFVGRFAVEGSVGFDALISFDPFAFDARLWLGLDLLLDGDVVCGIGGDLRLRGPNRYEINGKVWASVLGVTVKVKVNKTWGNRITEIPQTADGVQVLRDAVRSAAGFEPIPAAARVSGVGFARGLRDERPELIDPSGGVRFLQRAMPLAVPIDRIGTSRLVGPADVFDLAFTDNGEAVGGAETTSQFVRGAFFDLDEADRLRGPATEAHESGVELRAPDDFIVDEAVARTFDPGYETVFLGDDEEDDRPVDAHTPDGTAFERFARIAAERASAPRSGGYVPDVLRRGQVGVRSVGYVAVGEEAVDQGPKPIFDPDGSVVTGPLSAVRNLLGRGERALARHLAAPVE